MPKVKCECIGGPWDKAIIRLTPPDLTTAIFRVREYSGRYRLLNRINSRSAVCVWEQKL